MGTYHEDVAASREAARIAAAELHTQYQNWWETLDGPERRVARSFLGFGIPSEFAAKLAAAGLPQVVGVVASSAGLTTVWLPRAMLTAFIAAHPVGC